MSALSDFKNPQGGTGVVKSTSLVEGQVSISNTATVVTIETCFEAIGDTPTCTSCDATSAMKNEIEIE